MQKLVRRTPQSYEFKFTSHRANHSASRTGRMRCPANSCPCAAHSSEQYDVHLGVARVATLSCLDPWPSTCETVVRRPRGSFSAPPWRRMPLASAYFCSGIRAPEFIGESSGTVLAPKLRDRSSACASKFLCGSSEVPCVSRSTLARLSFFSASANVGVGAERPLGSGRARGSGA